MQYISNGLRSAVAIGAAVLAMGAGKKATLDVPSNPNYVHHVTSNGHCDGYMMGRRVVEQCDHKVGRGALEFTQVYSTTAENGVVKRLYFMDKNGKGHWFEILPSTERSKKPMASDNLFSNDPSAIEAQVYHTKLVEEIKGTQEK